MTNKITILKNGFAFQVPADVMKPLVDLIIDTESMDNTEKQYWFDIYPEMTRQQIWALHEILSTEKQKLEELEAHYQEEIRKLNEEHLKEWSGFITKPIKWEQSQS